MGNLLKGVSSESAKVGARWPERKSFEEAQSLKPSPVLRRGFCNFGIANAPSATTGASFSNSRRLMLLNLRLSTSEFIRLLSEEHSSKDEIRETAKCYKHNPQLGSYFRWQILQAAIV